ncbi:SGNH/GDSL hydrolase family protein [Rhizomonospora bruguierae]|uniref:SGNH/GDSL hydrolase family protein n=1 Tax=Rhizomonospora bruguierae TaxID=1581705 RepID=UPI001BCF02AE|nr:SGNH/GDSL hydrolase family protein [Micromonospora sp. NBRC 107566]
MPRRWTATAAASLAALVAIGTAGCDPRTSAGNSAARPSAGLPSSMAALGDSITAGYGSCVALVTCGRNSWSTGDGGIVDSHYRRIRAGNPAIRGHATNLAAARARAAALADQATRAVAARPAYVTILIGANDACHGTIDQMTPVADFRSAVDRGLATLKDGLPSARVLVASIPDLNRLWEVGHDSRLARNAWSHGLCPALLANPTSTAPADTARRRAFAARVDAYNRELAAACRAYGRKCRYDGGAVHRVRFTLDDINGIDFFHPNVTGQSRLAKATWPTRFTW